MLMAPIEVGCGTCQPNIAVGNSSTMRPTNCQPIVNPKPKKMPDLVAPRSSGQSPGVAATDFKVPPGRALQIPEYRNRRSRHPARGWRDRNLGSRRVLPASERRAAGEGKAPEKRLRHGATLPLRFRRFSATAGWRLGVRVDRRDGSGVTLRVSVTRGKRREPELRDHSCDASGRGAVIHHHSGL